MSDFPTKTFHFNGLSIDIHPEVYEPAEDTFQLLEAIEINQNKTVLEIGTGCGIIALECARMGSNVICTDINPYAIDLTKHNFIKNRHKLKGNVEVRLEDIFSTIKKDEQYDVVIFNPPYLPTLVEDEASGSKWFNLAVNGGTDGLYLIRVFIRGLPKILSKNGRAYFIFSSLADRKKLNAYLIDAKLQAEVVLSRCFGDEILYTHCVHY